MKLALVIDMNLSPDWVPALDAEGVPAVHWSQVGSPSAPDDEIMRWARDHRYVVFTHDLDFGALLALRRADGPGVIQVRSQNVLPVHLAKLVVSALHQYEPELAAGALIVLDEARSRVRILPI